MLRKRKSKHLKLLMVKLAATIIIYSSLVIPSMYYMTELDTNRRKLQQVWQSRLNNFHKSLFCLATQSYSMV